MSGKGIDGRASAVISVSRGASSDPFDMYATTTALTIGTSATEPKNRMSGPPQHRPTGYSANFRPSCKYDPKRDDDARLRELCAPKNQYLTSQAQAFTTPTANRQIHVDNVSPSITGFVKEVPRTLPLHKEVYENFGDTRALVGGRSPTKRLPTSTARDPLAAENNETGPGYMSTETRSNFGAKPIYPIDAEKMHRSVGPVQASGFTNNRETDPVSFRPPSPHTSMPIPSHFPQTVVQESFLTPSIPKGNEHLPPLNFNGNHATSYTREGTKAFPERIPQEKVFGAKEVVPSTITERVRRNDPADYLNVENPKPFLSTTRAQFTRDAFADHEARIAVPKLPKAARYNVGRAEESGYTQNEDKFVEPVKTDVDRSRFTSTYSERFVSWPARAPIVARDKPANTGFARATRTQTWDAAVDTSKLLSTLRPEVALTMIRKDPLAIEDPHKHKRHATNAF